MNSQINITESAARGLTTRFFNEMKNNYEKSVVRFFSISPSVTDRNSHKKFILNTKKELGNLILCSYEGGSNSQPYFVFDLITIFNERKFNSWKEKCLIGNTFIFSFKPRYANDTLNLYSISEHAIFRLYCRIKPVLKNNIVDYKYILNQMNFIPLWSNYWIMLFLLNKKIDLLNHINIHIPAPDGLFLANYSKESKMIEIRTFVADYLLSDEQLTVKKELLYLGKFLSISPLSFTLAVSKMIDFEEIIRKAISFKIYHSKYLHEIKNIFFKNIENDRDRNMIKNEFEKILRIDLEWISQEMFDDLQTDLRKKLVDFKMGYFEGIKDRNFK